MIKLESEMKFYFDNANVPLVVTEEDEEKSGNAIECWLCNQPVRPSSLLIDMNTWNSLRKAKRSLSSPW